MLVPAERKTRSPAPIGRSKLLLVEGETPAHFFEALLVHLGISATIEVRSFGGNEQLRVFLWRLMQTAEFSLVASLAIVRDAEDDPQAARMAVDSALQSAAEAAGIIPPLKVVTFVLPDDQRPGMIETLLVDSVRAEPAFPCVEEFFECAAQRGVVLPMGIVLAKSHAQAYLATTNAVQVPLGITASRGVWPWDNPLFEPLKQFLLGL